MKKIILLLFIVAAAFELQAQAIKITGKISDEKGVGLPGATIIEKGTSNGVMSDANGKYSIQLSKQEAVLTVSFIGYKSREITADRSVLNINLQQESDLNEVVVVGYGVQKKVSVVGSISTASAEDLKQMGTPNLSNALAGRVSGVVAMTGNGRPGGDDAEIFIRGVATLDPANSKPLILVDGIERDFTQVDPEDIESFSVLKDASATAVYGVRGANGVILITTKRGVFGEPVISASLQTTLQQPTRLMDYLGSYDHALLRNEALANDGLPARFTPEDLEHFRTHDSPYTHPDNDYNKDFLKKTSSLYNSNVSVRGGTDRLKYYVSANGLFQDGIYKQFSDSRTPTNAHFQRLNVRSNLDFEATKSTTVSLDLNSRVEEQQNTSSGDVGNSALFSIMNTTPPYFYPYLNPDGSYGANIDGQAENILAVLKDYGYNRLIDNVLEGTFRVKQKLDFVTKGLYFNGMVSFNSYFERGTKVGYWPETYLYKADGTYELISEETPPWIDVADGSGHSRRTNMDYSLNYARNFGNHDVSGMLLYTQTQSNSNAAVPHGFLGYVGRATYSYKQRYLSEFNFGYNGSDQFDKSHRYGFFPSGSIGWIASEETFVKKSLPFISFLKFRGSYGKVGNDKIGTDRFLYLQTYANGADYFFGTDEAFGGQNALYEGALGNTNVTWEIGEKSNIGMDMRLFHDKVFLNVDLFREMRTNIFTSRNTRPLTLGVALPKENVGEVENKGFEVEAGLENHIGQLRYNVRGMISYNKNTVVFQDEVAPRFEYLRKTGKPVGQNFGLTVLDYYTPDDFQQDANGSLILQDNGKPILKTDLPQPTFGPVQPGDFSYWDRNGDGVIDSFDEGPLSNTRIPKFLYSLSYGLGYKNFDLFMMWQGAGGNDKFVSGHGIWEPVREADRFLSVHETAWTMERYENGEEIGYPRLSSTENKHNHRDNSYFLRKGDYIRLKNVELAYNFPKKMINKIGMSNLRFFVSGTNLLTFDYMKIMDPENSSRTGSLYPQMKLWNLGFNVKF